jgi:hypothetical protein
MFTIFGICSAMLRLNFMDTADILILIGQLPEPRTPPYIVMGDRGNPDIMDTMITKLNGVHPF